MKYDYVILVKIAQSLEALRGSLFPLLEILRIDAKLPIITEVAQYEEFSMEDILRLVETDYRSYYQELCGSGLNAQTKTSIIFNVV